jgi:hypothetical protein
MIEKLEPMDYFKVKSTTEFWKIVTGRIFALVQYGRRKGSPSPGKAPI